MTYQHTSREAWREMIPHAAKLNRQIMEALSEQGLATCQQIEETIQRDHQAVSGNLRHLVTDGYVKASGSFGLTKSGRKAILWQIA
jgi:predicted transcriptional regulator